MVNCLGKMVWKWFLVLNVIKEYIGMILLLDVGNRYILFIFIIVYFYVL